MLTTPAAQLQQTPLLETMLHFLAIDLDQCEDLQCMNMKNSTRDKLTILFLVSLGAGTVASPSKGYDSHGLSLKEFTIWNRKHA